MARKNASSATIRPLFVALGLLWASVVPAAFVVNTTSDTLNPLGCQIGQPCSLRDAITLSQGAPGWAISFAIGTGPQTISLMSNLPDIITSGGIDGNTQPGFAGTPLIEIRRSDAGTATRGLHLGQPPAITQGGVTIRSLVINHFSGVCADCGGIIIDNVGGNFIRGNWIGTDAAGMAADGNSTGILDNSFGGNQYGGVAQFDRNVISGNSNGIIMNYPGGCFTDQNIVQGNYFGTNALGTGEVHNAGGAIFVGLPCPGYSTGVLIGGPRGTGAGNVIAGIGGSGQGIQLASAGDTIANNNVIQGNFIGLDKTGLGSLPIENGIVLMGDTSDKIVDNVISVTGNGIEFLFSVTATTGTKVQNNYIGTDITGNNVLVTGGMGINFSGGQSNLIGGSAAGQGNVIGGFQYGIFVGTGSSGNVIQGNRIGIGANGSPIPNHLAGIYVNASGSTIIGGENPGEGNVIAFNGYPGTAAVPGISVVNTTRNTIQGNSIYGNSGLGIDLSVGTIADGVTPNDSCDVDTGPNNLQNYPAIAAVNSGPSTTIRGTLNSQASTGYRLEFFANTQCHASGFGEGQGFIGYLDVVTDAFCNGHFSVTFPYATSAGQAITATATDQSGNTSEFSACRTGVALPARVFVSISGDDANVCSFNAPCRTFNHALSQVAIGGEIIVLKSGGYGIFTATQAVSVIVPGGIYAGITASAGSAVIVDAQPFETVTLKGLTLTSSGALNGVDVLSGSVTVESCAIEGFFAGIQLQGGDLRVRNTRVSDSSVTGVLINSFSRASLEHCQIQGNAQGLSVSGGASVAIEESVVSGNSGAGVSCSSGTVDVADCVLAGNGSGADASGSGTVRVSDCLIAYNTTGLAQSGSGVLASRTDNTVESNASNSTGTISSYVPK
jgi:Right handed beta helix region